MAGAPIPILEIAVQDAIGTAIAAASGADRVELCSALSTGGVTPSVGAIESTVAAGATAARPMGVHVLIRPRPGGFVPELGEVATMRRDVVAARDAGAAGVVVGVLTADGSIDERAMQQLVDAAEHLDVTCHRAFDVVVDRPRALDRLAALGVRRVLTSGGAVTAIEGVDALAQLVAQGTAVDIMAGGGVRAAHVPRLAAAGVAAVHLSARRTVVDPHASGPGGGDGTIDRTDPELVEAAVAALREVA